MTIRSFQCNLKINMLVLSSLTCMSGKSQNRLFFYVLNFNVPYEAVKAYKSTLTKGNGKKSKVEDMKLPEAPQNCCMSGCSNCVWVAYAEELINTFNNGGEVAKQKILEHVKDPNLRAFVMLELSHVFKEKK